MDKVGFLTSERTKEIAITNLRRSLNEGLKIFSEKTRAEMSTFVQKTNSTLAAQDGCYDDRVIAAALAVTGHRHLYRPQLEMVSDTINPFSFKAQRDVAINGFVDLHGEKPSDYYERWDSRINYDDA
jgi:hypothetical protein